MCSDKEGHSILRVLIELCFMPWVKFDYFYYIQTPLCWERHGDYDYQLKVYLKKILLLADVKK